MPFARPTLSDLVSRISADFKSRLSLVSAPLRRSLVYVVSRVFAGAVHMLHGHLEFLGQQIFADISEDEFLVVQAGLYGLAKTPATFATGIVTFSGTPGVSIPAATVLRRQDGAEFDTDNSVVVGGGGSASVYVTALSADAASNTDAGAVLTFESPVAGVDSEATVDVNGITGGSDEETTEALRTRLLQRFQNPPEGGAEEDYRTWALNGGATRVWVYPRANGAGTVVVRFMRDTDAGQGFPTVGEVGGMQAYIDDRRPVTADVTVVAPVVKAWNFTIAVTPNTTEVHDAVEAELEDLFLRDGEPGETLRLWKVEAAIANADGLTDYTLTTPAADLTHAAGELPTVGVITWS